MKMHCVSNLVLAIKTITKLTLPTDFSALYAATTLSASFVMAAATPIISEIEHSATDLPSVTAEATDSASLTAGPEASYFPHSSVSSLNASSMVGMKAPETTEAVKNTTKKTWSYNDHVINHLQSHDKITWTDLGNGKYATVDADVWATAVSVVAAVFNASSESRPSHHLLNPPLQIHNLTQHNLASRGNYGQALGYAVNRNTCYNGGAKVTDAQLASLTSDACNNINSQPDPPDGKNGLKIYQTSRAPDANGKNSYIRFSSQWIPKDYNSFGNVPLCLATLDKFNTLCQNGPGQTQGGEFWLDGQLKYNADPTDLDCNC